MSQFIARCLCSLFVLSLTAGSTASVQAQQSFSASEVHAFHERFEPPMSSWDVGGDFTRYVYLNTSEFWTTSALHADGPVREMPVALSSEVASLGVTLGGREFSLDDYVQSAPLDGVIVIDDGVVIYESYPHMSPDDRHLWFSVSKTLVSLSVGLLEERGLLDVSQLVSTYLPRLSESAWQDIPVIDILDMASGIACPEVLREPESCFWTFFDALGWPVMQDAVPDPWSVLSTMTAARPSGTLHDYTSVNTELLQWLVEEVSGERYADFVEQEIWAHSGAASDALLVSTPYGQAMSAGGMTSTLRDLARYGMMYIDSPVVSDAHRGKLLNDGRPDLIGPQSFQGRILGPGVTRHSTWQWDVVTVDGDFYKSGHGGQGLYVSPSQGLVIAWFGTHGTNGRPNGFQRIARQLAESGLMQ